jgi:hypothetical protein
VRAIAAKKAQAAEVRSLQEIHGMNAAASSAPADA